MSVLVCSDPICQDLSVFVLLDWVRLGPIVCFSRVTRAGLCSGGVRVVFGVCSRRCCNRWVSVSTICLLGLDVFLCWVS